jgi:hypothetical protein
MSSVPGSTTNLVLNGGFETPAIPNHSFSLFNAIPGWNLARGHSIEVQHNIAGTASEGSQFVELDSDASSTIYQDLATAPGQTYVLSFAFSPRPNIADNHLQVLWGNTEIANLTASGVGKAPARKTCRSTRT